MVVLGSITHKGYETVVSSVSKTQSGALDYCSRLESGWRLPSAVELSKKHWVDLIRLYGLSETWTATRREMGEFTWMDKNKTPVDISKCHSLYGEFRSINVQYNNEIIVVRVY